MSYDYDPPVLTLRWTCQACGWSVDVEAPGFAGDGHWHFINGRTPCGPITAQRVSQETPSPDSERP